MLDPYLGLSGFTGLQCLTRDTKYLTPFDSSNASCEDTKKQVVTSWKTRNTEVVWCKPQIQISVSVKRDGYWQGESGLTCLANLPRMYKGYINQCHCPFHSPAMASSLHTVQSSFRFHVSALCCCFLLWAEFYTVCQSPERHTLEGPLEWDTKSDPSGEQFLSHLCLFLFIFHPSLPLSPSLLPYLFSPHTSFTPSSSFLSPTPSTNPQNPGQVWTPQIPSILWGYTTSVSVLSAQVVGQSRPTSPSMHLSECATNEHDWRNVPVPYPAFLFDNFHSQ